MKAVFDTNILIDYLCGIEKAKIELEKYQIKVISIISWIELLVGIEENSDEEQAIKSFLNQFKILYLDKEISEISVSIKRKTKMKLPDAIILATSIKENVQLITRNTKDFSVKDANIKVPYVL